VAVFLRFRRCCWSFTLTLLLLMRARVCDWLCQVDWRVVVVVSVDLLLTFCYASARAVRASERLLKRRRRAAHTAKTSAGSDSRALLFVLCPRPAGGDPVILLATSINQHRPITTTKIRSSRIVWKKAGGGTVLDTCSDTALPAHGHRRAV
jgi:hypothetical protein